ncbi:MAG TPA: GNAT family N-acetyltransferase [Verrucomicrobiae bacterium]
METNLKTAFIDAIDAGQSLPEALREHVAEVSDLEEHQFDRSYIEFLDEQIGLSPRGPEWTERLKRRRAALSPYCDVVLIRGNVRTLEHDYYVEIYPETKAVIHWEDYIASINFTSVISTDFDTLLVLRIAAMRESLERVGRFDPERARIRLQNSFYPEHTQFILWEGERVGFYTFRLLADGFHLDHLYVHPSHQSRGIGSQVMKRLIAQADAAQKAIHVGALRGSESNRFYQQHGFVPVREEEWDIYYVRECGVKRTN